MKAIEMLDDEELSRNRLGINTFLIEDAELIRNR